MCGIAGCVASPGRRPDLAALQRMETSLEPRGPDDSGIERWQNVGLVNTRLAIVDPGSAGRQPMADHLGRWLITYNGEVYNHLELRSRLPVSRWRGHSDTETLVEALAAWGQAAVEHCNGPIAFAAVDKANSRLLLARDRFGKKPLYVARHDGALWFASEMRALLAAGVPARPRLDVLAHAVVFRWPCGRGTPVDGIERVPPGTVLSVDLETHAVSEDRWYEPSESVDPELGSQLQALKRKQLVDRLERELRAAVKRRLMADVPVGTMCSGGLDSSLITALARDEHRSVAAFNCSLIDEPSADEGAWGQRVAEELGIELESVVLGAAEWRAALVEAVRLHEYPLSSPGAVPISLISGLARSRGVKVLLTGEGADELFGGYPRIHPEEEHGFLPLWVRAYRYRTGFIRRRFSIRSVLRRRGRTRSPVTVRRAAQDVALEREVSEHATSAYSHHTGARARWEAALVADLSCSQFPFLLNRMDKDAMGRSVETRVPFLDPEVVALSLNVPLEARTQPRVKGILRDVGRRNLPTRVAIRTKYPGMLFDARRRIAEAARPGFLEEGMLRDLLGMPRDRWRDLLDRSSSQTALRTGLRLWSGEIWARLFLEGHSAERVEADLWVPERM